MEIKNYIVGAVACLALVLGAIAVATPSTTTYVNPTTGEKTVKVGGLAGPDVPSQYLHWGGGSGVYQWPTSNVLGTATTSVCIIQSPAATSTLLDAGIQLTTSSTTASTVVIAKGAAPNATTTILNSVAVAANATAFLSVFATTSNYVFAPSTYLVMSMNGGIGTFSPVGLCNATFESYL